MVGVAQNLLWSFPGSDPESVPASYNKCSSPPPHACNLIMYTLKVGVAIMVGVVQNLLRSFSFHAASGSAPLKVFLRLSKY